MVVMVYRGNVITISCPKFSFSRNGPLSSRNTPPARPEPLVYRVTSIVKRAQRHCYRLCLEKEGRRIESPSVNSLLKSIIEKGKKYFDRVIARIALNDTPTCCVRLTR